MGAARLRPKPTTAGPLTTGSEPRARQSNGADTGGGIAAWGAATGRRAGSVAAQRRC